MLRKKHKDYVEIFLLLADIAVFLKFPKISLRTVT